MRTLPAIIAMAFLVACGPARTSFVPLEYPNPDQAMIAILQHISVEDARASPDIIVERSNGNYVFKPVPALDRFMAVTLGEALLRDYPVFAQSLMGSDVRLVLTVRTIEGDILPGQPGAARFSFNMTAISQPPGGAPRIHQWTAMCNTCLDPAGGGDDWLMKAFKERLSAIVKDFIRSASPYLPAPIDQRVPRPVVS